MSPLAHAEDACPGSVAGRRAAAGRQRRLGFPWLRLWLGSGAVTVLVAMAGQSEPTSHGGPRQAAIDPAPVRAPPPEWQDIERPAAFFAVTAPHVQDLALRYAARRDRDGAREDILTFGAAEDGANPFIRLAALQTGEPVPMTTGFYVDLARRAAEAGLAVVRSGPADGVMTKLGTAEVADAALAAETARACLAFRLARPDVALHVGGWFCGEGSEPPAPRRLACLIDGLSLRSAENAALSALFAEAERRRDPTCAPLARVAQAVKAAPPARKTRGR